MREAVSITHRLAALQTRLDAACAAAGRRRSEVRLLAASKTHEVPAVGEALGAGQTLFGESRAQELRDKARQVQVLGQLPQPEWHFIGHLQRNKVKYVVGTALMVHTVDSLKLAEALGRRVLAERSRGMTLPDVQVLVQVNLGSEWKKSGVDPDETLAACHRVSDVEGLSLRVVEITDDDTSACVVHDQTNPVLAQLLAHLLLYAGVQKSSGQLERVELEQLGVQVISSRIARFLLLLKKFTAIVLGMRFCRLGPAMERTMM